MAAQRHTPFHAPWAVAGPTAISFQGWEGPGMRRGLPHPWFPRFLRALWTQEVGATYLWELSPVSF